jgi:hypothetical protein
MSKSEPITRKELEIGFTLYNAYEETLKELLHSGKHQVMETLWSGK